MSVTEMNISPELDKPVEWRVQLHRTHHYGGLSLHQCPQCFALVVEDFMPDHERWHEQGRKDRG